MQQTEHSSDDFINLSSIKSLLLNIFRGFFKLVSFIVGAVQKHVFVFIFCCLIGLIASYVYFNKTVQYFEGEMLVQQNALTRKAYQEIIANLNSLLRTNSYENFSAQLKIQPGLAKEVLSIEATSINDESLEADTSTKGGQPFKIHIRTINNTSSNELQEAVLQYLNTNPVVKLIVEGHEKIYLEKLQFIDKEQKKLDTLKSNYNYNMVGAKMPATFYNNALDPAALYEHSLKLANEKEKILKWLNNESQPILLIDSLKTPANPQSKSLIDLLLIGLTLGVCTGLFICFLLNVNEVIKKRHV